MVLTDLMGKIGGWTGRRGREIGIEWDTRGNFPPKCGRGSRRCRVNHGEKHRRTGIWVLGCKGKRKTEKEQD